MIDDATSMHLAFVVMLLYGLTKGGGRNQRMAWHLSYELSLQHWVGVFPGRRYVH